MAATWPIPTTATQHLIHRALHQESIASRRPRQASGTPRLALKQTTLPQVAKRDGTRLRPKKKPQIIMRDNAKAESSELCGSYDVPVALWIFLSVRSNSHLRQWSLIGGHTTISPRVSASRAGLPCQRQFPKSNSRPAQVETALGMWRSRAPVLLMRTLETSGQRPRRKPGSAISCEAMSRVAQAPPKPPPPARKPRTGT